MDSSYHSVRGEWITRHAGYIREGDSQSHLITNSYWRSPADHEYAQLPALDLNQVHYYTNTEERSGGRGYPSFWNLSSGLSIDTNPANAWAGARSLKLAANGSEITDNADVYCKPNRSYTVRARIKTSGVSGSVFLTVKPYGGSSPGSSFTLSSTSTTDYTLKERTFTTGSTADHFGVIVGIKGSSGTGWIDDIEVIDNVTGRYCFYGGGFESPEFGDDEFEWGIYNTMRTVERYNAGPNGVDKPWGSGEWGLMGDNADLSYWARKDDNTKPRKDSTGIHVHNCLWSQVMASSALNSPTYWWVEEYIIPFDLQGCWKGITTFASKLPFYEKGDTVSTDPIAAVVRASSSHPRIRVLGQRKDDNAYLWIQNSGFSWSKIVRDNITPTATSADITIPGFTDGSYTVQWYDTNTGALVRTESRNVTGGKLVLRVDSLSTDTACIVCRDQLATLPSVELTLTVDKTSASPGDELTYTVGYSNKGSGAAKNVEITFRIPTETVLVTGGIGDGGTYDSGARTVKWLIPNIDSGASGTRTLRVKVL